MPRGLGADGDGGGGKGGCMCERGIVEGTMEKTLKSILFSNFKH